MATSGRRMSPRARTDRSMDRRVDHELVPWCACPPCARAVACVSMKDGHLPGGTSVSCTFTVVF